MKATELQLGYFKATVALGYKATAPYICKGRSSLVCIPEARSRFVSLRESRHPSRLSGLTTPSPRVRQGERNETHVKAKSGGNLGQSGPAYTPHPHAKESLVMCHPPLVPTDAAWESRTPYEE